MASSWNASRRWQAPQERTLTRLFLVLFSTLTIFNGVQATNSTEEVRFAVATEAAFFATSVLPLPPRQAVSLALGRASALLSGARLDVQSVSMAVPRWSDFLLLHRVQNGDEWQVSGALQSSDASWLKTAEVVLAPRTAKSQTVTVWTNVTLVDAVSSRSVVVEVSHMVRSMPDPRSLVSSALLQPIVVESREDEAALVSMVDLDVFGASLDSAAVWSEYWSVDVEIHGRDLGTSMSGLVFDGKQADVQADPIVVESREDEAALVSMVDLDVFGASLDSAAVWSEYWSVRVVLRGVEWTASIIHAALSGVALKVAVRGGGRLVELVSREMTPCDLFVSDGDDDSTRALELHPQKGFAGKLSGTMVFTFYSKNAWMKTVEIARPLRVYWKANAVDEPAANATQVFGPFELQSVVFEYETVSISPR
ncbi:hypothetical protein PC121_g11251, partial [Phytophthora cactorum]